MHTEVVIRQFSNSSNNSSKFRIYTKKGDTGLSYNFSGERLPKDHLIFEALGANDELTSAIGLAYQFCEESCNEELMDKLEKVQCVLQDVGSSIATPRDSTKSQTKLDLTQFDKSRTNELEKWIDALDDQLPPLKNFVLPSGGRSSAALHLARSICRRAERRVVPLIKDGSVDPAVGMYMNRLSDFLFTCARFAVKLEGRKERIFKRL
eukprot:m.174143 g.174143  ORF g.174143 m.174143 type:complete len:208 (+) comp39105_c0_seq20:267-890(+)